MATIPTPKMGATVSHHKLKVGTKSILLTKHESSDSIMLYFGSKYTYCIEAQVTKEDSLFARIQDVSIGHLGHVYYHLECSLEHNFRRGLDTTMITRLSLSYIRAMYPHIRLMKFNDMSHRTCDNGHVIELAEMNYISTGKTWYEKHFHAYIEPTDLVQMERRERAFQEKKKSITWDMFKGFILADLPLPEGELREAYNSAKTWQKFFGPLRERLGVGEFSNWVVPWLHRFIEIHMEVNFAAVKYLMPIEGNTISYEEQSYRATGGYTRKHFRLRRPISIVE